MLRVGLDAPTIQWEIVNTFVVDCILRTYPQCHSTDGTGQLAISWTLPQPGNYRGFTVYQSGDVTGCFLSAELPNKKICNDEFQI